MTLVKAYQGKDFAIVGTDLLRGRMRREAVFGLLETGHGKSAFELGVHLVLEEKFQKSADGSHYFVLAGTIDDTAVERIAGASLDDLLSMAEPRNYGGIYPDTELMVLNTIKPQLYHRRVIDRTPMRKILIGELFSFGIERTSERIVEATDIELVALTIQNKMIEALQRHRPFDGYMPSILGYAVYKGKDGVVQLHSKSN